MKKLLSIFAICLALQAPAQIISDVYLQRKPIDNFTSITSQSNHKYLLIAGCCGNFGPDNLEIHCDPGCASDSCVHVASDSNTMWIPEYYEFILIDPCTGAELTEGYKQNFYLVSGNEFPYIRRSSGVLENLVQTGQWGYDPAEWDSIIHYGIPDTSLADAETMCCDDPYTNCMTGVTRGRSDCYSANKFDITGIADGTYFLKVAINLPASVTDPGVWPNSYMRLCHIQGMTFSWTDVMPNCCTISAPAAPAWITLQKNVLNWAPSTDATQYVVSALMLYNPGGGWQVDPTHQPRILTTTTGTSYQLGSLPSGMYLYSVQAKNCAGTSNAITSKKDKQ